MYVFASACVHMYTLSVYACMYALIDYVVIPVCTMQTCVMVSCTSVALRCLLCITQCKVRVSRHIVRLYSIHQVNIFQYLYMKESVLNT
jgi:hypothetical protein